MNNKLLFLIAVILLIGAVITIAISGCIPGVSAASIQDDTLPDQPAAEVDEKQDGEVVYQTFTLPGSEVISFELPSGWDFWGNGGYLSPDNGTSFAGLRQVWLEAGKDVERMLFNEDAIVLDEAVLHIGDVEVHRYTVETSLTNASTGEIFFHAFELVYAFPAPNGETMAGVFVSAPSMEALENLVPVAEHMLSTLRYGSQ